MKVKRQKRNLPLRLIILAIVFYTMLRIMTQIELAGGFNLQVLEDVFNNLYKVNTPLLLTKQTLMASFMVTLFILMWMEVNATQNKKNMQEDTHGSAEWGEINSTKELRDKEFINNMLFSSTDWVSKNMHDSGLTRNILLVGKPGRGKSRYFFKPNILSATGTLVITDPKGELLRDTGYSLRKKGYQVKVLNVIDLLKSNQYNPFNYIRKNEDKIDLNGEVYTNYSDQDVLVLINGILKNTKSDNIDTSQGDPFWEKAETAFIQSLFFLILYGFDESHRNLIQFMRLLRMLKFDKDGNSTLDVQFDKLASRLGKDNIASASWESFKVLAKSEKTMSTIVGMAVTRFASLNIEEVQSLFNGDDMEFEKIGADGEDGKIAYFIIIDPLDETFKFITGMFFTQFFRAVDRNAKDCGGELPTGVDIYMDEWAQLGEVPNFLQVLAYVRGLNCGVTVGVQSLSQLKKRYPDDWETVFDCVDFFLFMGSASEFTLEYLSKMLGKKTWYKKSTSKTRSRQDSSGTTLDVVGRELATIDELKKLKKNKCILQILDDHDPLYSTMYNLNNHPFYHDLYEPRQKHKIDMRVKEYKHEEYLDETKEERELLHKASILGFNPSSVSSSMIKTHKVSEELNIALSNDNEIVSAKEFLSNNSM